MKSEPQTNGAPKPGLGTGTEGDAVRTLQSVLKELGVYSGPEDGVFGPSTEAAVREVQRKHGLPATGVADSQTEQVIATAATADIAAGRGTTTAADPAGQLVVNETNKRLVITAATGEVLVLSPLERRRIADEDLKLFENDLRDLERQCIVALPAARDLDAGCCDRRRRLLGARRLPDRRVRLRGACGSGSPARSRSSSAR